MRVPKLNGLLTHQFHQLGTAYAVPFVGSHQPPAFGRDSVVQIGSQVRAGKARVVFYFSRQRQLPERKRPGDPVILGDRSFEYQRLELRPRCIDCSGQPAGPLPMITTFSATLSPPGRIVRFVIGRGRLHLFWLICFGLNLRLCCLAHRLLEGGIIEFRRRWSTTVERCSECRNLRDQADLGAADALIARGGSPYTGRSWPGPAVLR